MLKHLFSPIQIRGVTLPNRVIMPATGFHMPDENNFITPTLIGYPAARAAGGCGLNTLECCSVNQETTPPKHASIAADKFLPDHKALCHDILIFLYGLPELFQFDLYSESHLHEMKQGIYVCQNAVLMLFFSIFSGGISV